MRKEDLITKYSPGSDDLVVVIGEEDTDFLKQLPGCSLAVFSGFDWNTYLSPWPADAVFRRGEGFAGKADELIGCLEELLPAFPCRRRIIAGYSLAGLFAVYACTKTDLFDACVSGSGSMWYPGFAEYLEEHPLRCRKAYFSLGDREHLTKNPVMASVKEKTETVVRLAQRNTECIFESNPGNHFTDADKRLLKGILSVIQA
ncbi:MAG: hypothetical protein K6A40_03110 [Solobacterium sp.]|nr:hypothetical protein [Solobacterium sp.]